MKVRSSNASNWSTLDQIYVGLERWECTIEHMFRGDLTLLLPGKFIAFKNFKS
jgi:hypothetical protein